MKNCLKEMENNLNNEREKMRREGKMITSQSVSKHIKIKAPDFFMKTSLGYCVENQEQYFTDGKLALGTVLQANEYLYKRPSLFNTDPVLFMNLPAVFLYAFDDYYYNNPAELLNIAVKCGDLLNSDVNKLQPEERAFKKLFENDEQYSFKNIVPASLTGGKRVFSTSVYVVRNHILKAKLAHSFYPLMIIEAPENAPEALILPHYYWGKDFEKKQ